MTTEKLDGFETIEVTRNGPIARITLARPERLNAMGAQMLREIARAANQLDEDVNLRAVIVSGQGRAFSAGADLKDPPLAGAHSGSGKPWIERHEIGHLGRRMVDAVDAMRAVTVAACHGHVVGGGVLLMMACDLRVAAADTTFCIPEVELGIPLTWGGIPRLVREIGPARTKELVITCRNFSAQEADGFGLLNRVVPPGRVEAEAGELAATVASMPSVPVATTKAHVRAVADGMGHGSTAFADADALLGSAFDPESQDAMARYVEKKFSRSKPKA